MYKEDGLRMQHVRRLRCGGKASCVSRAARECGSQRAVERRAQRRREEQQRSRTCRCSRRKFACEHYTRRTRRRAYAHTCQLVSGLRCAALALVLALARIRTAYAQAEARRIYRYTDRASIDTARQLQKRKLRTYLPFERRDLA